MILSTKTLGLLALLSAIGFGVLVIFSEIYLNVGDGLLDGRLAGYDAEAVRQYLGLLSDDGLSFYKGTFRVLDTIFPPLFAFTLGALIWKLGRHFWRVTVVFPLVYLFADLRENALVGRILASEIINVDNKLVESASNMTQLKWLFLVIALVVVLWLWRKGRGAL